VKLLGLTAGKQVRWESLGSHDFVGPKHDKQPLLTTQLWGGMTCGCRDHTGQLVQRMGVAQ